MKKLILALLVIAASAATADSGRIAAYSCYNEDGTIHLDGYAIVVDLDHAYMIKRLDSSPGGVCVVEDKLRPLTDEVFCKDKKLGFTVMQHECDYKFE